MEQLMEILGPNSSLLIAANLAGAIISLLLLLVLFFKHARLQKQYQKLVRGMDNKNLEEILMTHLNRVDVVSERVEEVTAACKKLSNMAEKSMQKVGIVRFNAFADTGSDLSFAVALLDHFGDGVVLSSIFGRDDQRTYAKPIKNGTSSYHLSGEEIEAIEMALKQ